MIGSFKKDSVLNPLKFSPKPPYRITKKNLVILPSEIGEAILFSPVIKNLRQNFGQDAQIDVIGNKKIFNLFEKSPYLNNFYFNEKIKDKAEFLKKHGYDSIFLFNFPILWSMASLQTRVRQRISFDLERLGMENLPLWRTLITHMVSAPKPDQKKSQTEIFLEALTQLKLAIYDTIPEIICTDNDFRRAEKLLRKVRMPIVAIHANSSIAAKEWEIEKWAEIITYINSKTDCSFISLGEKSEKTIYEALQQMTGIKIHNFCGKTTLRESIEVYKQASLLITVDTAAAHLAAAGGINDIIVLYGPSDESQWKPISDHSAVHQIYTNIKCRPCNCRACDNNRCLSELSSEAVIDRLNNI